MTEMKRTPLQVMLAVMDGDTSITAEQLAAAIAAAPYVHPKLSAVNVQATRPDDHAAKLVQRFHGTTPMPLPRTSDRSKCG
jgi:hypothetical protein